MRVLVVSGSSGGHIFPALALIEALKEKDQSADILLLLPKKGMRQLVDAAGISVRYIPITAVKKEISFRNLAAIFDFLRGSLQGLFIISSFRPEVVLGFGSIATVPVILLAWLFRIKTLIHEQNVLPGAANKLLAVFADRIAVSFSLTADYLSKYKAKVSLTGNPVRRKLRIVERESAEKIFQLAADKFTILVMGGSQGSAKVNAAFFQAVSQLKAPRPQVIHLSGPDDLDSLKDKYRASGIEARVYGFFPDMQYAYSVADLVVSRAGAAAVTELIIFKLPAIICPYPFAGAHQLANAKILNQAGAAVIIEDNELYSDKLKNQIEEVISHPQNLQRMRAAYNALPVLPAADLLAQEVISL